MDMSTLMVLLAFQVSILPIQAILWLGIYNERRRLQSMLRLAIVKINSRG